MADEDLNATPVLPGEPSPITDAQLPALVDQLRPILAEIAKAASADAVASTPVPRVMAGTVTNVDVATLTVSVLMDDSSEGAEISASILSERPNPNERVMVMWTPGGASYVFGHVGGDGVPPGTLSSYTGRITAATSSSSSTAPPRGYVWAFGQNLEQRDVPWYTEACGTQNNNGSTGATQVGVLDMRGRIPIGLDNMGGSDAGISSLANVIGTAGGAETHSLTTGNLPNFTPSGSVTITSVSGTLSGTTSDANQNHTHVISGVAASSAGVAGGFDYVGLISPTTNNSSGFSNQHQHNYSGSVSGGGGTASFSGNSIGSGSSVNHLPPVRVVHWIVKI